MHIQMKYTAFAIIAILAIILILSFIFLSRYKQPENQAIFYPNQTSTETQGSGTKNPTTKPSVVIPQTAPTDFKGPTGQPHIKGPSGPPPKY